MNKNIVPIVWMGEEKEIVFEKDLETRGEELTLLILLVGKDDETVHVKINVRHAAPDTTSKIIMKGALTDRAKVDFDGLVKIEKGAKNSNAWLGAHLLLLSPKATGRAVPNLEIAENEVKAGHGATVGRVSEEDLFYLMSRGLSRETGTRLIVQGFLESLLTEFPEKTAQLVRKKMLWTD